MRFYLAHNYAASEWLKENIVPVLEREGHIITSRWLHLPERDRRDSALRDLEDVDRADALILFGENFGPRPGRGKFVEFGYARAKGKQVIVIGGKKDCVFYELPDVQVHETFDQFYQAMTERIGLKKKWDEPKKYRQISGCCGEAED